MIRLIVSEPSILLNSKLNSFINSVIEEKNDFNYHVFDFEETPIDEIIDSLQTPSFGSDKKVVVCKNPYFIKDSKMKLAFDNNLELLDKYLDNPNPDSELVIICPKKYYNSKSKFIGKLLKKYEVENLLFEDETEFVNYGNQLIIQTKIQIDSNAKTILFERCNLDVCKLEREIAKLALYAEPISVEIIEKMVSRPLEDDVFELSNALLLKNRQKTMKIYNDLKLLKVEPIQLIALLSNQFRLILQVGILKKDGKKEAEIATLLAVHPYRVKLACKHLFNYNLDEVKKILIDLANLDVKIKKGEADRYIDFELFLSTK